METHEHFLANSSHSAPTSSISSYLSNATSAHAIDDSSGMMSAASASIPVDPVWTRVTPKYGSNSDIKVDIFASLRSLLSLTGTVAPKSTKQQGHKELDNDIGNILGSEDDEGSQENSYKGFLPSSNDVEDDLQLIHIHNQKCHDNDKTRLLEYDEEESLLDAGTVHANMVEHFANPGQKRETGRKKLYQRMMEAKENGNHKIYQKLEVVEFFLEQRILDEFTAKTLKRLKKAIDQAEMDALEELRDLDVMHKSLVALISSPQDKISALHFIIAADVACKEALASVDDALTAIDTGHLPATSHLLYQAHRSARRATTRFSRMYATDVEDPDQRRELSRQRFGDPMAGAFIGKAILEMKETRDSAIAAEQCLDKTNMMLSDVEMELARMEQDTERGLLGMLAVREK